MTPKTFIDKHKKNIVGIVASLGIAAGFSNDFILFIRIFISSFSIFYLLQYCVSFFIKDDPKITELETFLIESDGVIQEQEEVIKEYERILDSMSTQLPCACGGNMFEGIFQPAVDNFVECEKCKSKYKVLVSFDSILISEPLDQQQQ